MKKINNNFALAQDSSGETIIVEGRGIGFRPMPCELDDLSKVKRTYYGIKPNSVSMLENVREDVLQVASDTYEYASRRLPSKLNQNLTFILADHIQFCIDRIEQHINVKMPIYYDIEHLYPVESDIARFAMRLIRERLHIVLPVAEKTGIALNIINSEIDQSAGAIKTQEIISLCTSIIETTMGFTIDRTSFSYSRFVTHLEYLLKRTGDKSDSVSEKGLDIVKMLTGSLDNMGPEFETCLSTMEIELERRGYPLNDEERMYLIMHLVRICDRSKP